MQIEVDVPVAAFLMSVAVLTALVTGLVPVVRTASQQPYAALKEGTRGSSEGVQHQLLRTLLVVGEVALAVVLVAGASLMLQSVWRLTLVDRGFDHGGHADVSGRAGVGRRTTRWRRNVRFTIA